MFITRSSFFLVFCGFSEQLPNSHFHKQMATTAEWTDWPPKGTAQTNGWRHSGHPLCHNLTSLISPVSIQKGSSSVMESMLNWDRLKTWQGRRPRFQSWNLSNQGSTPPSTSISQRCWTGSRVCQLTGKKQCLYSCNSPKAAWVKFADNASVSIL